MKTVKAADIQVLRCLNPQCRGLLAYEVDKENFLYVDLAWTARQEGDLKFFPCPKCGAKNVVEEVGGANATKRHRVTSWRE